MHTVIYNWYNNICFICHRSQKTSALQKDSGLHASNCGMSLRGLSSGQVLGYSTTPRTIQQLKANLSVQHTSFICQQFHRVNELQCFIVLMLDDFHNIHSLHTPSQLVRTNVIHMASCLADVHPSVHAVPRPAFPLHRQVTINVNGEQRTCAGGIDINDVLIWFCLFRSNAPLQIMEDQRESHSIISQRLTQ